MAEYWAAAASALVWCAWARSSCRCVAILLRFLRLVLLRAHIRPCLALSLALVARLAHWSRTWDKALSHLMPCVRAVPSLVSLRVNLASVATSWYCEALRAAAPAATTGVVGLETLFSLGAVLAWQHAVRASRKS